jgi:tetrahydromethanopterin S-methyltransferase subunit F
MPPPLGWFSCQRVAGHNTRMEEAKVNRGIIGVIIGILVIIILVIVILQLT